MDLEQKKVFVKKIKDQAKQLLNNKEDLKATGQTSEDSTSDFLIRPMIEALGYDTRNAFEYRKQYKIDAVVFSGSQSGRVDYAIFPTENKDVIYIEAKAFNKKLDVIDKDDTKNNKSTPVEQLFSYMLYGSKKGDNIIRGIVTNGDEWRIYYGDASNPELYGIFNLDELANVDSKVESFIDGAHKLMISKNDVVRLKELKKEREETAKLKKYFENLLKNPDQYFDDSLVDCIRECNGIKIDNKRNGKEEKEKYRSKMVKILKNTIEGLNSEYYFNKKDNDDGSDNAESEKFVFEDISEYNSSNKLLYYTVIEQKIAHKILSILKQSDVSSADLDKYCIDKYSYKDVLEDGILVKHCNANSGCLVSYIICDKVQEDIVAGQIPDWAIRYGNTTNLKESDEPAERDAMNGAIAFNISDKSEFEIIKGLLGDLGKFLSDKQNQGVGMNSSNNARCWISLKDIPLDDDASDLESVEEDYLRKIDRLRDAIVYCYKHQIDLLKSKKS